MDEEGEDGQKVRWKKKRAGVVPIRQGRADPRFLSLQLTAGGSNMADKTGSPREGVKLTAAMYAANPMPNVVTRYDSLICNAATD